MTYPHLQCEITFRRIFLSVLISIQVVFLTHVEPCTIKMLTNVLPVRPYFISFNQLIHQTQNRFIPPSNAFVFLSNCKIAIITKPTSLFVDVFLTNETVNKFSRIQQLGTIKKGNKGNIQNRRFCWQF
jgi:hypothetical protein